MSLCEVGDIAVVENFKHGILECPVIYVNDHFIIVKHKFYDMTINIMGGREFNPYINELNKFIKIKRGGKKKCQNISKKNLER